MQEKKRATASLHMAIAISGCEEIRYAKLMLSSCIGCPFVSPALFAWADKC